MMDPVLYSGESPPPWPIESTRDPLNGMPAGAENITSERRRELGVDVFWEVVDSGAEFERPQPPSIQHKIKSLLLDMDPSWCWILVQFWAPIRTASGQIMLTASHQPFGMDSLCEGLRRFRSYCAEHQYGVSVEDTNLLGPPGRVFTLGSPELCPDVQHYSQEEFPWKKHALDCGIESYAALPLFEGDGQCCVGVLELSSLQSYFFDELYAGPLRPLDVVPLKKYDLEHEVRRCKWCWK